MRSRPEYYHLIGKLPVPVDDLFAWAAGAELGKDAWRVAQTTVGPLNVSTIFLGMDHAWTPDPEAMAILFETMIFGHDEDAAPPPTNLRELLLGNQYQRRYSTWDEAEKGHAEAVEHARRLVEAADATWRLATPGLEGPEGRAGASPEGVDPI